MGFSVPWTTAIQMLVLALALHSTAGNSHEPLIVLDNYEDNGIQLTCFSERRFSDVQVLWIDSKGHNLTGSAIPPTSNTDEASAKSSILLKSGSDNAISCNIIDNVLKTSTKSTVVIADVFFPATSPWMTAFIVILLISIALVIAAIYKLKKNNETTAQAVNDKKAIEDETKLLEKELETEQQKSQQEIQAIQEKSEKAMAELDFRRARSNAVNITLDSDCKHPELSLKDKNRVVSTAEKKAHRDLIVVANEGFSEKKQYWEVEVGDKPEWELGVLTENERGKLKKEKMEKPPEKEYWSLRLSEGQYHCSWKSDTITPEDKKCPVVGIFLDWEEGMISFYNVEQMCLVVFIIQEFQGKLYPFFNPGSDKQYLGIRPVSVPSPLTSL
ncbi:butyrophilin subfamily 2 member A1-like [Dermochelys coriacea]|uniref:butyrophilin subfamily 2 member A1-like n=1 Tax=Dermochelys coriacea TaxID=27794 RepID=UPI0018E81398|nr:butyrophilin subfamily 2 member A1-like [Dermochelys coriacea]XP_043357224.1 butyrophilin subfamily 2 member A1-like [Dermochelys coriacea]XP_043357225.1 butyrophilin subfamily 2 member A1-like [Dermochelys coriacea]